ncbi:hypothetical protein [Lysinibacillus irui]|uniref:Pre-toxin TG domain-containing protein n=2 Tax=Lysinibacillus TaxID=400634 RepID=A0AAJ5US42_9BACI|nr:hypothetical protein [Lysinibacillus irui]WDV05473.1 hypothetical protein OU989_14300 [Lysinibacillus irui]
MGLLGLAGSLLGMIPKVGSPSGKKKGKSGGSKGKSAKKSSKKKSSTKKKQRKSNKKKKKKKRKKKKKKWGKFFTKARKLKNSLSKSKLVKRAKKAIKKAVLTTKKVVKKTKAAVSKAKQQVKAAVKQTKQVVKKQVLPAMKKAAQATTKAVKNAVKPKNLLNTLQTGLDIVGMVPVVGEVADGVNGIIYAARGDKVNAALSFGAMIPVVGNAATAGKWVNKGAKAAKGISESAQKANKGLLGNVKEKVNKQVANAKTQIQAKVDEVKQQLRQLGAPQMELAGVNVGRISDTGTVGKNTSSSSPKPSNSQPSQNGSNKKPDENKGTGKVQTRTEIMNTVQNTMSPAAKKIKEIDPDAKVGYRGSLATGQKGPHKGNAPFDPTDFDIDAFIVSDKLASQFPPSTTWKAGTQIKEIRQMQKEIDKTLKSSLDGIRKVDKKGRPDNFTFRIYTQEEFISKKYSKGSKIIEDE